MIRRLLVPDIGRCGPGRGAAGFPAVILFAFHGGHGAARTTLPAVFGIVNVVALVLSFAIIAVLGVLLVIGLFRVGR